MDFKALAQELQVEEAALRAVVELESCGSGFLADGRPKILFEPFVFYKELKKMGIDPAPHMQGNEDILWKSWKRTYGKYAEQWPKLQRAMAIHKQAALRSASYGLCQVMGFNHKVCGYALVEDFVDAQYTEEGQLRAFVSYLQGRKLIDELQNHEWANFAYAYNGPGYAKNAYDSKLEQAYKRFSA